MGDTEQQLVKAFRARLKAHGWWTWKNVGTVATAGLPDVTMVRAGVIAMAEFKRFDPGIPGQDSRSLTPAEAVHRLTGSQKATMLELWRFDAPAFLVLGDREWSAFYRRDREASADPDEGDLHFRDHDATILQMQLNIARRTAAVIKEG